MSTNTLYRLCAGTGMYSAFQLVCNVARRAGALPDTALTRGVAPLSAIFGLLALTGLYLWQRQETGRLGLVGYALNAVGLAGSVGIEYVLNYVFPYLGKRTVDMLVHGAAGTIFLITAVVFMLGALLFGMATLRAGKFPALSVPPYALGSILLSLRNTLPEWAVTVGGILAALAVTWLSVVLWTAVSREQAPDSVGATEK